jgi:hypothetical protein
VHLYQTFGQAIAANIDLLFHLQASILIQVGKNPRMALAEETFEL